MNFVNYFMLGTMGADPSQILGLQKIYLEDIGIVAGGEQIVGQTGNGGMMSINNDIGLNMMPGQGFFSNGFSLSATTANGTTLTVNGLVAQAVAVIHEFEHAVNQIYGPGSAPFSHGSDNSLTNGDLLMTIQNCLPQGSYDVSPAPAHP
jgi:hypothetical protein